MNQLKVFIFWVFKVSAVLVFVFIAISILIIGYEKWETHKTEMRQIPLAEPKTWSDVDSPFGNFPFTLTTKWKDGRLYYQFYLKGYSKELELAQKYDYNNPDVGFTLLFTDKNGFNLSTHFIALNKMTRVLEDNGKTIGLTSNSDDFMSEVAYKDAYSWNVAWNIPKHVETAAPPKRPITTSPPRQHKAEWQDLSLWRKLEKGMSQPQVEILLGSPTKISGGIYTTWYYGYPVGGYIMFDNSGHVSSWSEP